MNPAGLQKGGIGQIMKIVFQKSDLASALNIVSKAVGIRSVSPILECVLITAQHGEIRFTANNNDLGIETLSAGTIIEEGMVALNARLFSELVRKFPESEVELEVNAKNVATVTCEASQFKLLGQAGEEFPDLMQIDQSDAIEISEFSLKEAIRQTIFSIADQESNPVLTGELFEVNDNELKIVALDGHRIAIRRILLNDSYGKRRVIVPGKSLMELSKILEGDADEIVQIVFSRSHLMFRFGATMVITGLIDGNYFDVNRMIYSDFETKVTVNKRQMQSCMDRACLLSGTGEKKPVIMSFHDSDVVISASSFIGSMNEVLLIEKEGKNMEIGFNPKFILDVLRVIDDEDITMYLINQKYPCVIKDADETYLYLVLPVNISA